MVLNIDTDAAAQRSALVAPTSGGARGRLCPQTGFRRVDEHTLATYPAIGAAGMATGHRSWRHLIT